MTLSQRQLTLRNRLVRSALPLLLLAVGVTLLGVSGVKGGGGGGGVEIYPVAYSGPPGTGGGNGSAMQWITLHSRGSSQQVQGSMNDSGVRVRQHVAADIVTTLPGGLADDWSLDLTLLSPTLRVWEGPGMINLDGHYILTDQDEADGEDLRLHNGFNAVRSRLIIVVGQRHAFTGKVGVPESFFNILQVIALPVPGNLVSLESARSSLANTFQGSDLDVALGLFTQDGAGVVSQAWAAFRSDDALAVYEIETR